MIEQEETTRSRGDALEKNVEFLFESAGFETSRNVRLAKYEIDILAKIGDRTIIVECKNYQNSDLTIRNLIHQWNSKNIVIKANKIVLVLAGLAIKESDYLLAKEFDIELWNENDLSELFNLSLRPAELREKLLEKVEFSPITIREQYRDRIIVLAIKPILTGSFVDNERVYFYLNSWLRTFIRTDLQLSGTTKEERLKHIELFEGTKSKRVFFNLFEGKRTEVEYWEKVSERLLNESILSREIQSWYKELMDDLLSEYKDQLAHLSTGDIGVRARRLIRGRLHLSLISESATVAKFGFRGNKNAPIIIVEALEEGRFKITIPKIDEKQAEIVNWLLTSEHEVSEQNENEKIVRYFSWSCLSVDEAEERTFRILEEFVGFDSTSSLCDFSLI